MFHSDPANFSQAPSGTVEYVLVCRGRQQVCEQHNNNKKKIVSQRYLITSKTERAGSWKTLQLSKMNAMEDWLRAPEKFPESPAIIPPAKETYTHISLMYIEEKLVAAPKKKKAETTLNVAESQM